MAAICAVGLAAGCRDPLPTAQQSAECEPYQAYQGHEGTTVTMSSVTRDVEADRLVKSWETFEECTGIDISYVGSDQLEATLEPRLRAGEGPDMAVIPQPGLVERLARADLVQPASEQVRANATRWWSQEWLRYGTVDGTLYAAPLDANLKSLVWYSPRLFRDNGYEIPTTWQELLSLSEQIAADGVTPWCAGIESGAATGWPATDWLEDVLLRTVGGEVYDRWVAHDIPFDDPRVVDALERVGEILRNPDFVNGGYGGVESIATTAFQEGGLPILEGSCAMHRQASFYATWWPTEATIGEEGDLYAFPLPPVDPTRSPPLLVAGTFTAVFADRPEVDAVATYLTTPEFADNRARFSNTVSANQEFDPNNLPGEVARLSADLIRDPAAELRFDGSDAMSAQVGSGTFWAELTEWIKGKDSEAALRDVEASWPDS